ncbi:MAG: AAA family ATPase [bacterium]|nr:AAA family ATPase [bacterium]
MFDSIIGQEKVKKYFLKAFETETVPHSILLYGPPGTGKTAFSIELARILTCHSEDSKPCGECVSCRKFVKMEHPDIQLFFPITGTNLEKKAEEIQKIRVELVRNPYAEPESEKNASLGIEMVRLIKQSLRLQSYQGKGRVIILIGCDALNQETGNALLKILEEPPDKTTIILTTSSIENVLPTIKSRCRLIPTSYLTEELIIDALTQKEEMSETNAAYIAKLSGGSYSLALESLTDDFPVKKAFAFGLLEKILLGSKIENVEFIENWLKEKPKISEVKGNLYLVIAILKMRYESMSLNSHSGAYNGFEEIDKKALVKLTPLLVENMVVEIEKFIDLLNKNVYLNLILMNLILRLRKLL